MGLKVKDMDLEKLKEGRRDSIYSYKGDEITVIKKARNFI